MYNVQDSIWDRKEGCYLRIFQWAPWYLNATHIFGKNVLEQWMERIIEMSLLTSVRNASSTIFTSKNLTSTSTKGSVRWESKGSSHVLIAAPRHHHRGKLNALVVSPRPIFPVVCLLRAMQQEHHVTPLHLSPSPLSSTACVLLHENFVMAGFAVGCN